jgi:hypothetical protein
MTATWVEALTLLSDEAQCAEGLADAIGIDHAIVGAMSSARGADLLKYAPGAQGSEIHDRNSSENSPDGKIVIASLF